MAGAFGILRRPRVATNPRICGGNACRGCAGAELGEVSYIGKIVTELSCRRRTPGKKVRKDSCGGWRIVAALALVLILAEAADS